MGMGHMATGVRDKSVISSLFRNRYGMWESVVAFGRGRTPRSVLVLLREPGSGGPAVEQINALEDLRRHIDATLELCFQAVSERFQRQPPPGWVGPTPPDAAAWRGGLRLVQLHIPVFAHGGISPVGFEFDCDWSCEHGVGVLTHRGRVVDVGAADVASLEWKSVNALAGQIAG
jgi:hypothetical protein